MNWLDRKESYGLFSYQFYDYRKIFCAFWDLISWQRVRSIDTDSPERGEHPTYYISVAFDDTKKRKDKKFLDRLGSEIQLNYRKDTKKIKRK